MISSGLKRALLAIAFMASLNAAYSQDRLLKENIPASYTVAESDTLWNIASQFLQNPERWQEIWQADTHLDNSDLIYPGDMLKVGFVGGSPRILVTRGDRTEEEMGPIVREEPLTSSIPAIPLESIENSFTRNRIVSAAEYELAPYIVSNTTDNLAIGTGDEIYARGIWPTSTGTFEIYRQRRLYLAEDGGEALGLELEYLGFATVTEAEGPDLRRMIISNSSKEIKVGDRLLIREESRINATIFPTEPNEPMEGRIIGLVDTESMASQLDSVVINLGREDGLEIGNILSIRQENGTMVDEIERERMSFTDRFRSSFNPDKIELPGNEIGTLLIYKIFDQLSYALIISSMAPAELYNRVTSP